MSMICEIGAGWRGEGEDNSGMVEENRGRAVHPSKNACRAWVRMLLHIAQRRQAEHSREKEEINN